MTLQAKKVQHNVFFEFQEDVSQEQIDDIFGSILKFKTDNKIPGILLISHGPHKSPEGLNQGFNYGLCILFENEMARDAYIPHPEHQKIVDKLIPLLKNELKSVVAVDWYLTGDNQA